MLARHRVDQPPRRRRRGIVLVLILAMLGLLAAIGVMFAMGAILAVSIPRVPKVMSLTGVARSGREVWLERFYLLVLSLGLLIFYVSVRRRRPRAADDGRDRRRVVRTSQNRSHLRVATESGKHHG